MLDVLLDNTDIFIRGFSNTIQLFVLAAIGSLILGTILAMLRISPVPALRTAGTTYVTILRNTPLTLVFFFFVFAYPKLEILNFSFLITGVIALTVYTSAFVCEVVRSGINTVPIGQAEASRALGLSFVQALINVLLPQAFRATVPPLVSVLIALLKNTTIAAGFSVTEAGAIIPYLNERGESTMNGFIWIAFGFLILVIPLTLLQRFLEKRWSVSR